jgi:hypothetical protein
MKDLAVPFVEKSMSRSSTLRKLCQVRDLAALLTRLREAPASRTK